MLRWIALFLTFTVIFGEKISWPDSCQYEEKFMKSFMACTTLPNEVIVAPISLFQIKDVEKPLEIKKSHFLNIGLRYVNTITISNSTLKFVDKDAFANLTDLIYLGFANNELTYLPPEIFKYNSNLNKVNITNNPFDINQLFRSDSIQELLLERNNIQKINGSVFKNVPNLTYLDLSYNNIEKIAADSFDVLEDLNEIILSHNKIQQLKKYTFSKNTNLQTLDLSYNLIEIFSGEHFSNLEELNLRSCLLKTIDRNMFKNVRYLHNLDLSYNQITDIHVDAFQHNTDLIAIDLSGNKITALNENWFLNNNKIRKISLNSLNLREFPKLGFNINNGSFDTYYFSCNDCNLSNLPRESFKNMPALISVFLSHNKITDISNGVFKSLPNINELVLSWNQIITVDDNTFSNNPNLNKLTLSGNPLKALHAGTFKHNVNLKYLDLSQCGLFTLWSKRPEVKLQSIMSLNISHNHINMLTTDDIAVTSQLRSLDLSDNPLECTQSLKDLVKYLSKHNIFSSRYVTNEQNTDYEFYTNDPNGNTLEWKYILQKRCSVDDEYYDDDINESYNDDFEAETEQLLKPVKSKYPRIEETEVIMFSSEPRYRYTITPIVVFIGTTLIVLGTVANLTLCILRHRASFTIPRIISVQNPNRFKNNSGLVYHQLSEENIPNNLVQSKASAGEFV